MEMTWVLMEVCPVPTWPPYLHVPVRAVEVLVAREYVRLLSGADGARRAPAQLRRVVVALCPLALAGAPRREGDGASGVVEVALHLVKECLVRQLDGVLDGVDA